LSTLQQDLDAIQARLEAHEIGLEATLAAITATYAKHEAIATANRNAVLEVQAQRRADEQIRKTEYARLNAVRKKLIEQARSKQNE
jgi:hypothetical protein